MSVIQWCRVALIYGMGVLASMTFGLMGPLAGDVSAATHMPANSTGLMFGVMFLPFVLGATFIGRAADRIGARNMLFVGAAIIAIADMSNMKADTAPWLLINNGLLGLGMIAIIIAGQTELSRVTSGKTQASVLSFWATAPYGGMSSGLFLGGSLAASPMWRWAFAVQGLLTLGLAIGALFLIPKRSEAAPTDSASAHHHQSGGFRALLKERRVFSLSIGFLCLTLASSGNFAIWPLFLSGLHNSSIATIAKMTAFASPFSIPGALITGYLLARTISHKAIVTLFLTIGIVSALILYTPGWGLPIVGIAMVTWTIAIGATTSLIYATLPSFVSGKGNMGAATGMMLQLSSLGGVGGAPLFFALTAMPKGASIAVIGATIACWFAFLVLLPIWRSAKAPALAAVASDPV